MKSFKTLFKEVGRLSMANFMNLVAAGIAIIFLPKAMSETSFGFFQFIQLVATYANILQLGLTDGIYLKYGGEYYENLDFKKLGGQFSALALISVIFSISFLSIGSSIDGHFDVYLLAAILIFVRPLSIFFQVVLQMTGRTTEYSSMVIIGNLLYISLSVIGILFRVSSLKYFGSAFVLGMVVSFFWSMYLVKDIVIHCSLRHLIIPELFSNMRVGIKLTVASYSALGIIGVVQWIVRYFWPISVFAKLSVALSLTNILLPFITAVSLVLFPVLKRNTQTQKKIYKYSNGTLNIMLPFALSFYFVVVLIIKLWIPEYEESIQFVSIIFPIVVVQAKYEIVVSTFLKSTRNENFIFGINLFSFLLSSVLTIYFGMVLGSITFMLISVVMILILRLLVSGIKVGNVFGDTKWIRWKDMWFIFFILFFLYITQLSDVITQLTLYVLSLIVYMLVVKNDVRRVVLMLKHSG